MKRSLTGDPAIGRAYELLEKHLPQARRTLWLNPPACSREPRATTWRFWQPHHADWKQLRAKGWIELEPDDSWAWETVVVYASKHKDETRALLDAANCRLVPGGQTLFVVPNDYGSKSYLKGFEESGALLAYETGRKSRLYRLKPVESSESSALVPLRQLPNGYWSCPGLFSWSEVDQGSALLAECMTQESLRGPVADLGAGWGYLASQLDPTLTVHLFEEDQRALECAQRNLAGRDVKAYWCDLSDTDSWPAGAPTSFATVITNPPFHSGQREEAALGRHFASLAHRLLPQGGTLWLVGNTHLGYPKLLATLYSQVEVRAQKAGFTVVRATK